MWFRIQSEGFITTAQTGGDIPPNWGHQSSCCCVLSSVQIAPFFCFNLFTFPSPPFLSPSLSRSLSLGSALISSRLRPPSFAFQVVALCRSSPALPSGIRRERKREREEARAGAVVHSWCFITAPHPDIWGRLFSHEHQCVINRINLGPNFLMIAVLMYVNECSLLTHYRQFAWDTHNQTL